MHDESNVGRWLLLLRDGSEAEQQLARTELGLILEARGLHDEAAEAYARNVEDGATDRRPFERLAALARLRGDAEAEAQALRALAELLSPTPPSPQPDTQNPDPREDLTPPAPLRGANIGFADIISGAERGEAQEFDVGPEEQAQGADVDEVVGDEVSNEGFVLADDDAWEEASVIAADNDESSRANGDTPAAAVADHDAESAVEDAAEWSVAADDGEALAGAGDDERAGDTGNLPADDKQSTVDELDQADEPSPQEQRLTVISQHPFTHPDAASSQGHQDGTDSLEDEVDSPSPVHRSRGSTDLEGEGIPTPPGDPDESPAADALVVDDALPVDVPASGQPDQDPQTVASTADAATAAPEPASAPTRSSPPRGASTADAISRLRMWEVAGSRSFGGAGGESQVANAVPERPRSQPAMFRLLATLIGLAVVVLVVVGALMVPVSRPLSVTPAKPAASPAAAEQLLPAVVPTAIPPPPPPSPSPTAPVVQAPAPSPSPPAVSLAARCTDAALRFPESRDAVGEVRAAFRGYMARQGVTIDPASTLFAGLAQAHADRHAEVMAGWMAVTLQRERRGLPTFPLVDYVASDIIVAAGPGEYQLRATISPQGWNELRALPPDSCEGAFLTSPENARWVELMQASVGDITWALPTPQPRR